MLLIRKKSIIVPPILLTVDPADPVLHLPPQQVVGDFFTQGMDMELAFADIEGDGSRGQGNGIGHGDQDQVAFPFCLKPNDLGIDGHPGTPDQINHMDIGEIDLVHQPGKIKEEILPGGVSFLQGFQVGLSKKEAVGRIGNDCAADRSQGQMEKIEKTRENYPKGKKKGKNGNYIKDAKFSPCNLFQGPPVLLFLGTCHEEWNRSDENSGIT
jgi:hypothetical protein